MLNDVFMMLAGREMGFSEFVVLLLLGALLAMMLYIVAHEYALWRRRRLVRAIVPPRELPRNLPLQLNQREPDRSRALLIASVEVGGLVEGEWGVLRVKLNSPSVLVVEGDVEWLDPGLVEGVVEVPVKARKAGRMPVAIVAKSSGKEERKVVWVEVAEGKRRVGAAALCPSCGAPREPGAKYCWRCGARLAG
ncbi:MAG: zinc ribbon domain-containing protein [Thermofilaceae archaeon]